jgi:hypothetical protein
MPTTVAPISASTRGSVQGGTAMAEDGPGSLLVLGVIVAVAAGVAIFIFTTRGGNQDASASAKSLAAPTATAPRAPAPKPRPAGIQIDEPDTSRDLAREEGLGELEDALNGARLWSTVSVSPESDETVTVRSGSCADEAMAPTLAKATGGLRALGFDKLQCLEKHGALVFEQGL